MRTACQHIVRTTHTHARTHSTGNRQSHVQLGSDRSGRVHGIERVPDAGDPRVRLGALLLLEEDADDEQRAAIRVRVHEVRLGVVQLAVDRVFGRRVQVELQHRVRLVRNAHGAGAFSVGE